MTDRTALFAAFTATLLANGLAGTALANTQLDVLFVIDNSASMREEQTALTNNFSAFVSTLEDALDGLPDVHIGVTTTDLGAGTYGIEQCEPGGDDGQLHNPGIGDPAGTGCPENPFIESVVNIADPTGPRLTNYSGTLEDAFQCVATVGDRGCGFEQPLEAAKRALDGRNSGFLRSDAYLLVVFVSDEDDCSADTGLFNPSQNGVDTELGFLNSYRCVEFGLLCDGAPPVREMTGSDTCTVNDEEVDCVHYNSCVPRVSDYFDDIKSTYVDQLVNEVKSGDANKLIVASVVGAPDQVATYFRGGDRNEPELLPACENANGKASAGVRLAWFAEQFPAHVVPNICDDESLSQTLTAIGTTTAAAILDDRDDGSDDQPDDPDQPDGDSEDDSQVGGTLVNGCQIGGRGERASWFLLVLAAIFLTVRRRGSR